jgi:hypothetical protein
MPVLSKPIEHDCPHPMVEHYISAADDRWHCGVAECPCSAPELVAEKAPSDSQVPKQAPNADLDYIVEQMRKELDGQSDSLKRPTVVYQHCS